jgi:hypothetical protein
MPNFCFGMTDDVADLYECASRLFCWDYCFSFFDGEFDPGSGRTLAACLTHASRTMMAVLARSD